MTTHNNMQIVREKVIEAVPSIKDLVFGCEVMAFRGEKSYVLGNNSFEGDGQSIQNHSGMSVQADGRKKSKGFLWMYDGLFARKVSIDGFEIYYEIIGRPITWMDIFKTLSDHKVRWSLSAFGLKVYTSDENGVYENLYQIDLLKPLEDLSEEEITMLANLLK